MEENKIVEMGEKIIKFIESKYKIETYYTEYFHTPDKILKIVFNYNFYTLYDFDKQTLVEIDYDENEIDITSDFNNYK